jgi:hypothetical protein
MRFSDDLLLRALDKAPPVGEGSQRMSRDEAAGGGKDDKEGEAYTVDPKVKHMSSRFDLESSRGSGRSINRKITRTPRPSTGPRSDFSTEGDGSSVLAPKPDWMEKMLEKMDPMARRALAAIEGVQKAIQSNDVGAINEGIMAAENALSMLKSDLNLHDQIVKSMSRTTPADRFMGVIPQYDNNASDYNGTENAVAMGVSRHGRSTGFFTPHRIV